MEICSHFIGGRVGIVGHYFELFTDSKGVK